MKFENIVISPDHYTFLNNVSNVINLYFQIGKSKIRLEDSFKTLYNVSQISLPIITKYHANTALLWQKEASDKSPKSEILMFEIGLSMFYYQAEF